MTEPFIQAGFATNPFRIVPPSEMRDVTWAGDQKFINSLMEAANSPRLGHLETSELVIVLGDYGTGKTNALKFLAAKLRKEDLLVAYIQRPAVADKATWHDIVRSIFRQSLNREDVIRRLRRLRNYALRESLTRSQPFVDATDPDSRSKQEKIQLDKLASDIVPESPGFFHLLLDLADPRDNARAQRIWQYLSGDPTKAERDEVAARYGLSAAGLTTDYEASLMFAHFVRALSYPTPDGPGSEAVYVLIDEVEGLLYLPAASQMSIRGGLRNLFDACTEHLFIGLAATGSDESEMWGMLDQALMQRLSRRVMILGSLEDQDAIRFLVDIMGQRRTSGFSGEPETPFSKDGLKAFVESCPPPKTARKLLVSAQRLVFQEQRETIAAGKHIEPADVYQFQNWGAA